MMVPPGMATRAQQAIRQPRRRKPTRRAGFSVGRTAPGFAAGSSRPRPPQPNPVYSPQVNAAPRPVNPFLDPKAYAAQTQQPQPPISPPQPPMQAGLQGTVTGTSAPITGTLMTPSAPGQNQAIIDAQRRMLADRYREMGITDPTAFQAIGQPQGQAPQPMTAPGTQGGIPATIAQALQNLPQTLQVPSQGAIAPIPATGITGAGMGEGAGAGGDPSAMLMGFIRNRLSPDWQAMPQNIQDLMYQQDQGRVNEQLEGAQERLGQQASRIYGRRAGEGTGTAMANFAELERGATRDLGRSSRDAQIRNWMATMGGQEAMLPFLQSQAGMRAQQGEGAIGRGMEDYWRQRAEEERGRGNRAGAMLGGANLMALLGLAPGQNYNLDPLMLLQGQF